MLTLMEKYKLDKNDEIQKMQKYERTYDGPAIEFLDPKESKIIRQRELEAEKELDW